MIFTGSDHRHMVISFEGNFEIWSLDYCVQAISSSNSIERLNIYLIIILKHGGRTHIIVRFLFP